MADDKPYGVDTELDRGKAVLALIAEGYDGKQIMDRHGVHQAEAERLILLYARRVLSGDVPPAPLPECRISEFDGWCFVHGCYHPATAIERSPNGGSGLEDHEFLNGKNPPASVPAGQWCGRWIVRPGSSGWCGQPPEAHPSPDGRQVADSGRS